MNTLKRITLAATAAASVLSMSAPAEVPEPTFTDYGWTRTYTQDGREFVVTAYPNPGSGYTFTVPDGISAIDYLVVGGGGSGGTSYSAGGGGAGGYLEANGVAVEGGLKLSITVGAGGAAGGHDGSPSSLAGLGETIEALGGGAGAEGSNAQSGKSGGSGGGASAYPLKDGGTCAGGNGTSGQGNNGGAAHAVGWGWGDLIEYGGGGGGAKEPGGANGSAADRAKYSDGGAGEWNSITGEEVEYARGGNGSVCSFESSPLTTSSTSTPIAPGNGSSAANGYDVPSVAGCNGIVVIRYELKKSITIKVTPNEGYLVSMNEGAFVDAIELAITSGEAVKLEAKGASEEVAFDWTGLPDKAVISTDTKSVTFTMPGESLDIGVTGRVTAMYTLAVDSTEGGIVTGTAVGTYIQDYNVALTATPNEHYDFVGWTVNGEDKGSEPTLAFKLTDDTEVFATFQEKAKYTLTVIGSDYGKITGGETSEYYVGTKVALTATPNEGLVFVGWGDDAASFGNAPSIELTMDANKTVSAKFGYMLTITPSPYGTITSDPSGNVFAVGDKVVLTATPNEGCEFLSWQGDVIGESTTAIVTMDQNRTVSALYKDSQGRAHYEWGWTSEIKNEKGRVTGYVTAFTQIGDHTFTVPKGVKEIDYLVVGGGGSGGASSAYNAAGGGGAGGFIEASGVSVKSGTELSITVGAGGAKNGNNGSSSLLAGLADDPIEALGGGAGGNDGQVGADGASGGGAGGIVSGWRGKRVRPW